MVYKVWFYRNRRGEEPVKEYLEELATRGGKDGRIRFKKIRDFVKVLSIEGTRVGYPIVRHLKGDIWELRPLSDRIFFVGWYNGSFVLLHHYVKKSMKTPTRELEQAEREYADLIERGDIDE